MAKRAEKPLQKILNVRAKLRMYVEFGDHALGEQTAREFAADVQECFQLLMEFRNIVNAMVLFDEPPKLAVLPYVDEVLEVAEDAE